MSNAGTKRPAITWGQFLDAAPWFVEAMRSEDDCLGPEWTPLIRAVAFFDVFRGQVQSVGVSQYLFNKADSLPHFDEAPHIVRQHPLLKDVADLMLMVHGDPDMIRHYVEAQHEQIDALRDYVETGEGGDQPITYEEKYRAFTDVFDRRAWRINDAAFMRIHKAVLEEPQLYFDIAPALGVTGQGAEPAVIDGFSGTWEMRLVDGFPIGPNLQRDEFGGIRILRFSSSRMHLDFDHPRFSEGQEPDREWIDFSTGVGQQRSFRQGHFETIATKLNFFTEHGLREYYEPNGQPKYSGVFLNGMKMEMHRRDLEGSPFTISQPSSSGEKLVRRYFGNGQLNFEQIVSNALPFRYTRCLDENGNDLAPNGTGVLREIWTMTDAGPRWRVGQIVDGLLHGEFRYLDADGAEWGAREHYNKGKVVRNPYATFLCSSRFTSFSFHTAGAPACTASSFARRK